jgi:hypothetical protein
LTILIEVSSMCSYTVRAMNTKMMTFVSTLILVLAGSASAQTISILPGGRGGLYIPSTPSTVPGPLGNIPRLYLPGPLLTPAVALTLAPIPGIAIPMLPLNPMMPAHEILPAPRAVPLPLPRISPNMPIQYAALHGAMLAAPSKEAAAPSASATPSQAKLEKLFDGRTPAEKAEDDLGPVRPGRHMSLPENDLEKEIGAY